MSQQMTHKEFCCWLEGFFMRGGETPTAEQWQMIGVRLQKVLNPAQAVTDQDVSSAFADKVFGPRVYEPKAKQKKPIGFRKFNLDECSQGEQKRNDEPVKSIAYEARESLNKDITPRMIMDDLDKQVRNLTGVPFHTPQAPFIEQPLKTHGVEGITPVTC